LRIEWMLSHIDANSSGRNRRTLRVGRAVNVGSHVSESGLAICSKTQVDGLEMTALGAVDHRVLVIAIGGQVLKDALR
jgi:hypothetical protein